MGVVSQLMHQYLPTYIAREPLNTHITLKKTAKFAIQVSDAAQRKLRFAGHRKWAGAYALSKRGLEKLTKSGYAQCTLVKGYIWTLGIYKDENCCDYSQRIVRM